MIIIVDSLNLVDSRVTYSLISFLSLIIRFLVKESFTIYYFKAILRRLIYKFSYTIIILLITVRSLALFTNKYISRKYVFLSIYLIAKSILADLLL